MSKPGATAEANRQDPKDTIFAKIVAGQIPCKKVYEDDLCLVFDDIAPCAPVHCLIIPKKPIGGVSDLDGEEHKKILGHMMVTIPKVAEIKGIDGYRLVINEGVHGCQSVRWLHIHIIGGKQLSWPPGCNV
ncbi:putative protein kinase C inhibitor [Tieghemostelium lacteum]|uniref:HIT domain-containing protein n=1 Tax=Tieghemostelium lacteum TaxID=361077 RepID=A0A151ZCI8_TIELA|nr:putative protein kinase C inhibitor [Tieghemostelium lacteum]|eukprot:KYQ91651.1 putative protein kinase C inhibitor [Tieghemostelium lacteum]